MKKGREAELEAIYRKIPNVHCQGKCQDYCGPLIMSKLERLRIVKVSGAACKGTPDCNKLTPDGRCGVYDVRPFICRAWGAVKGMECPHGCRPDRYLSLREFARMVQEVIRIGGGPVIGDDVREFRLNNPAGLAATQQIVLLQALKEGLIPIDQAGGSSGIG